MQLVGFMSDDATVAEVAKAARALASVGIDYAVFNACDGCLNHLYHQTIEADDPLFGADSEAGWICGLPREVVA